MMYVLLIVGISLVLGPIYWLRPSPRDQRIAAMRLAARSHHLQIELIHLDKDPIYAALALRNPQWPKDGWVRYRLFPSDQSRGPSEAAAWRQRRDKSGLLVWDEEPYGITPHGVAQTLLAHWAETQDARFMALEIGQRSVAIVWNEEAWTEKSNITMVEQVAKWLADLLAENQ
ncbi:Hypothetical protein HDN1F_12830 [gamma proteobacterium HdN1]|nr:Hypothetical protein HDN1F_12830 [gamma proteobacterium HdN1]